MITSSSKVEVQIDPHTLARAAERGADTGEIVDVVRNGAEILAKAGRKGRAKVFEYGQVRNGKFYEQKKVEVYYVIEDNRVVTVTVYVFYGKWEEEK